MKVILTLAWRNLWRNKRRTLITIASVFFAVIMAINGQSFQKGSYELMISNMVKMSTGYIQIQDALYEDEPSMDNALLYTDSLKEYIAGFGNQINFTVPRLQGFALAATSNSTRGVMVTGVDPGNEEKLNAFSKQLVQGQMISNTDSSVMLASGLADILKLKPGDTVVMIGQGFQGTMAAGKFRVKGIMKLRLPEMNNNTIYMSLKAAQGFYAADNRLTALLIMPRDPDKTNELAGALAKGLDKEWFRVVTWEYLLKDLLRLMEFDVAGNLVIIYILYVVIAFGIFGTVLTMMIERSKEFGMLISLGMKRGKLAVVCLLESVFISFIGAIAGAVASFPIVWYYHFHPIRLTGQMAEMIEQYGFEPIIPFSLDPSNFTTQAWIVFFIAFVIGLYPVFKVRKMSIIDASKR